jgi:hypothetical protein
MIAMTMRSISAAFVSRADAESARQQLAGIGVAGEEIHILEQKALNDRPAAGGRAHAGLWAQIRRMFLVNEDLKAQAQSALGSAFVLTASVDEDLIAAAVVTLESSNAVELDENQKHWRKNVWRGSPAAPAAIDGHAAPDATASARPPRIP